MSILKCERADDEVNCFSERVVNIVEYYGWLNVTGGFAELKQDERVMIADKVKAQLSKFAEWPSRLIEHKWINGEYVLVVAGSRNHRTKDIEEILELFHDISQTSLGAYGLLYFSDDEDKLGKDDEFQVFIIAKGQVTQGRDAFLSPVDAKTSVD